MGNFKEESGKDRVSHGQSSRSVHKNFVRPKKDFFFLGGGGSRPIYNLRKLNNVDYKHFKIKGFQEVKNIMINSDLFRKNDLTGT